MLTYLDMWSHAHCAALRSKVIKLFRDEKGEVNIIAMIVIIAIALALAVVFRKNIKDLFDKIWNNTIDPHASDYGNYS